MAYFDVSKRWIIIAGRTARSAAEELALYTGLLRERSGIGREQPPIESAETAAPADSAPIIILNAAAESPDRSGFTWRSGRDRIEIYGDSPRGLWNGIFDFLSALGFCWPEPGSEEPPPLPSAGSAGAWPLKTDKAYSPSLADVRKRRRLVIGTHVKTREREELVRWAARSKIDALIVSLGEKSFWNKARRGGKLYGAVRYALVLEAGGWDISLLLPRRLFFFHQDLFRMESGRRTVRRHFCSTNPQTIARITRRAGELFSRAAPGMSLSAAAPVFHLWPDAGHEKTWCACPACRAFSPAEQNRIAVNSAADALLDIIPGAFLSYFEEPAGSDSNLPAAGIATRKNMFPAERYGYNGQNKSRIP
jgi:hypothetical protein